MAHGGDPMPPGILRGALVRKNSHLSSLAQVLLKASRSQSSPIGVLHLASSHSCKQTSLGYGQASKPMASPATAAKWLSYNQRTVSSSLFNPMNLCSSLTFAILSSVDAVLAKGQRFRGIGSKLEQTALTCTRQDTPCAL